MLDMSPTTIFRAIEKKTLRAATTPGGHYRIRLEDLEEFLRKNNVSLSVIAPRTKRVLIVEDNPVELRMFQRALQSDVHLDIKATNSGYEAGFLTKSLKPDLILLDIFLGEMDGREIARIIRSDPELKGVKILAISGSKDPKVIQEIKDCGIDAFVEKPVSPETLRKSVRALLE